APQVRDALGEGPSLPERIATEGDWMTSLTAGYATDAFFSKVVNSPSEFTAFEQEKGAWYSTSRAGNRVLCVPDAMFEKRKLREIITDAAHRTLGHLGTQRTSEYVR
ncbi:hypothetical protein FA95DRAFT_1466083, partial [Auriscalpium vulgare]